MERPPLNERNARWMVKLQELDFDIQYIKGTTNVLADLCSRPDDATISPLAEVQIKSNINAIEFFTENEEIINAQTQEFIESMQKPGLTIEKIDNCYYETSTEFLRIVLPEIFRKIVIDAAHDLGHYGNNKTYNLVSRRYYWPSMRKQVYNQVQSCISCQQNKLSKSIQRQPIKFPQTTKFKTVHIDIVGPFPKSRNSNTYILTMIDRCTGWPEAIPMRSISAEQVATKFYNSWICRFGIPESIISDQGRQFESALFNSLLNMFGISHKRTTAYHPQTNGKIERMHRTLKNSIRCLISQSSDWERSLPTALYALRIALNNTGYSPSLLVYGEEIYVPWMLLSDRHEREYSEDTDFISDLRNKMLDFSNEILENDFKIKNLANTQDFSHKYVWIKDPILKGTFEGKYLGPFEILEINFPVLTINRNGMQYKINIDRTKPAKIIRNTVNDNVSDNEVCPIEESTDDRYSWTDIQ